MLALLLAAEMLTGTIVAGGTALAADTPGNSPIAGTPYQVDGSYDVTVPHVFINQVYGGGLDSAPDTYISNGFIELYNPTDSDVSLTGWSLQYTDTGLTNNGGVTGPWEKLDLTGTIKKHSSYLIIGKATGASSPKIDISAKGDLSFDRYINNKGLKVALVSNQTLLAEANPFATEPKPAGYVDMLGTAGNDNGNLIDGYETEYRTGKNEGNSKKNALRRAALTDADHNRSDFEQLDYSAADAATLSAKGPRSSADGAWGLTPLPLGIVTDALPKACVGTAYSAAIAVLGGKPPYTYSAAGLPSGLAIDPSSGTIAGTPEPGTEGTPAVKIVVTDSAIPAAAIDRDLTLNVRQAKPPVAADKLSVEKISEYAVGSSNEDGGVAEIVKYNKDNGNMYVVNGSANPPSLDIVALTASQTLTKVKSVPVKELSETDGFMFGDLTSVDVNTATKRVAIAVQQADPTKAGRILLLDYDGNLLKTYEAGVQPDMVKFTSNGKHVMSADEGEFRSGTVDPKGTVTIVDTTTDEAVHVEFDNPDVIDDGVHIRGAADPLTGLIGGSGPKADALSDLEPEYITLSEDETKAYVALQENNAIATVDIAAKKVIAVKGLGYKDLKDPNNALDVVKDNAVKLENVPFFGMYMPDGIASYSLNGTQYLFTANEGDATDWPGRKNATTIKKLKDSLDPVSPAAAFLSGNNMYDGVEAASDMGNDGVYLYGGRSFSIWNADTMEHVYDSGSDFERITGERLPDYFNASNSNATLDSRSTKKGPEPEYVAVGAVGSRTLVFTGLERIGGIMTYDVTDPAAPEFVNYTNTRDFTKGLNTDTGPEGLEFIPATDSPTGLPLLLVANEVGGTIAVLQLNVTKVTLDKKSISLRSGDEAVKLHAVVELAGDGAPTVEWSSSNTAAATVDQDGNVTPVSKGTATITALSTDGYGVAEAVVTVDGPWKLTVMHTNDTHAHLADVARRTTLVKQVRNETGDSLLLDAGDVFSGDLYFTKWMGLADLEFMNDMGYDAMTFGNHEFDQGTGPLAEFVSQARFPLVSANIDFSRDSHLGPLVKAPAAFDANAHKTIANAGVYPYIVLDVNGHKVGVFGLTTEDTKETSSPGQDIIFAEAAEAAASTVEAIKSEGVDIVIALSHLGYGRDKELAQAVKDIDLIVGGHTHTKLDAPETVMNEGVPTIIVQANEWGRFLGRVDLTFDEQGVVQTGENQLTGRLLSVDANVPEDEAAKSKLAPYNAELEELKKQVVGKSDVILNGERSDVRSKETNLGNFIADGMLAWAKERKNADVAIMNGGGIRASIDQGDITMGELRTVMPFGNTLYVLDVTGQALKDGLENGISGAKLTDLPGKFPQVAGLRFKWDPSQPAGSKVYDVEIKKDSGYASLDLSATYRLATNSFVANGGDGYASFAKAIADGAYHEDLGYPDYEIFIAHVNSLGDTIAPAVEGRIIERAKSSGNGSGSGSGGGGWVPTPVPTPKPEPKPEPEPTPAPGAGKIELGDDALQVVTETSESGQIVHNVMVKAESLQAALETAASGGQKQIVIQAQTLSGPTVVSLPAGVLASASGKGMTIVIETAAASYSLPLHVLHLTQAASGEASLSGVSVQVSIAPVDDSLQQTLRAKAQSMGASLVDSTAIEFKVAIVADHQEKAVNDFGAAYVARVIYLPSTADITTAAAVMYDPAAGEFMFVPGVGKTVNGKPAIEMKRPGNSIYAVMKYSKEFADLKGHWAKNDTEKMASKLIVKGVSANNFAPDQVITRAEFTALLVRGLGLNPAQGDAAAFVDVQQNAWYAESIGAAVKFGLVTGKEAGKFAPDAAITRAEMAVMIARSIQAVEPEAGMGGSGTDALSKFADRTAIPKWASASAALLAGKGIMQGNGKGDFASSDQATRAQAAVILLRALKDLKFTA